MDGTDSLYDFYSLADDKVVSFKKKISDGYLLGTSHGFLVYYCFGDDHLFLSDPITGRRLDLPSGGYPFNNVVISSHNPYDPNCRVVTSFYEGHAFCCPARSTEWTPFGREDVNYHSILYSTHQKLFFCLNEEHRVEAWDLSRVDSPTMVPMKEYVREEADGRACSSTLPSLVLDEKSDELYLVRRFMTRMGPNGSHVMCMDFCDLLVPDELPYRTTDFDVYKYDKETREWKFMDGSLGGMAIFVGQSPGFVLSAADYPELKPDSVYFTDIDIDFPFECDGCGGRDTGIFNYRNRTISPFYYRNIRKVYPRPFWFTPNGY